MNLFPHKISLNLQNYQQVSRSDSRHILIQYMFCVHINASFLCYMKSVRNSLPIKEIVH